MDQIDKYIQSFLNGSLDTEGHAVLRQWIKEKPENRDYFQTTVAVWKATGVMSNAEGFDVDAHLAMTCWIRLGAQTKPRARPAPQTAA